MSALQTFNIDEFEYIPQQFLLIGYEEKLLYNISISNLKVGQYPYIAYCFSIRGKKGITIDYKSNEKMMTNKQFYFNPIDIRGAGINSDFREKLMRINVLIHRREDKQ